MCVCVGGEAGVDALCVKGGGGRETSVYALGGGGGGDTMCVHACPSRPMHPPHTHTHLRYRLCGGRVRGVHRLLGHASPPPLLTCAAGSVEAEYEVSTDYLASILPGGRPALDGSMDEAIASELARAGGPKQTNK